VILNGAVSSTTISNPIREITKNNSIISDSNNVKRRIADSIQATWAWRNWIRFVVFIYDISRVVGLFRLANYS